ncbi:cell wall transcription factor Ace2p [[Candida] anglica]|uniref:Cell wall transcription factor Ace2p n=1 Tax=[Candida] anglica TaxID=148631 RepID=A0ABP0EJU8_9ASCO
MEYANWEDPKLTMPQDEFDQYFTGYNDMDNLFNETLAGLSDLDVPSGFAASQQQQQDKFKSHTRKISGTAIFGFTEHGPSFSLGNDRKESKSVSPGELVKEQQQQNIDYLFPDQDVKPIFLAEEDEDEEDENEENEEARALEELAKAKAEDAQRMMNYKSRNLNDSPIKSLQPPDDFIVTSSSPKGYKFPPSPPPLSRQPTINSYSVKYLQEFKPGKQSSTGRIEYADDIEPLLVDDNNVPFDAQSSPFISRHQQQPPPPPHPSHSQLSQRQEAQQVKYVPIPIQVPMNSTRSNQIIQPHQQQGIKTNVFLPPPSPPVLSHGSPDWSSPEPQSPSPSRVYMNGSNAGSNVPLQHNNNNPNFSSPVHPHLGRNFYTPQFFSDNNPIGYVEQNTNNLAYSQHQNCRHHPNEPCDKEQIPPPPQQQQPQQLQHLQQPQFSSPRQGQPSSFIPSSPMPSNSINSSPIKYYSPLRNVQQLQQQPPGASADDSIDVNATIVQLTPLKDQFQSPSNKMDIKWSPVISPNAKSSTDVRRAIQQLTPKRKVEKTSLLPPGELDQYWEGPDENKVFTCTFNGCGKKFTRRYNVRSHIQTHLSDRPFACVYCPKKFVRQHDLNRHVKGHQEARYCKCPCGKDFARIDAMRKHRARNICVGGMANHDSHCVSKPKRKSIRVIDDITSDMLQEELSSSLGSSV